MPARRALVPVVAAAGLALLGLAFASPALADVPGLRVGAAAADVTPTEPARVAKKRRCMERDSGRAANASMAVRRRAARRRLAATLRTTSWSRAGREPLTDPALRTRIRNTD